MKRLLAAVSLVMIVAVHTAGAGIPLHMQKKAELFGKAMVPDEWVELRKLLRAETGREIVFPTCLDRLCDAFEKEMKGNAKAPRRFQVRRLEKTLWLFRIEMVDQYWNGTDWINAARISETMDYFGTSELKAETWDGSDWAGLLWVITTFDPVLRKEVSVTQTYESGTSAWVNDYRDTWIYDTNGNNTYYLGENWHESDLVWVNNYQGTATYDVSGNILDETYQRWDWSAAIWGYLWVNDLKILHTYDAFNNRLTKTQQGWSGSVWRNSLNEIWTYDASQNMTSWTDQDWSEDHWRDHERELYAYDANGNMISKITQTCSDPQWMNGRQILYSYDAQEKEILRLEQVWTGTHWEDFEQWISAYDAQGRVISEVQQHWYGYGWVNVFQSLYYYHDGDLSQVVDQIWSDSAWNNYQRTLYTVTFNTDVAEEDGLIPQEFALANYPNPFNPETSIQFALPRESDITLMVYDIRGSLVRTLATGKRYGAGTHTVKWDGRDTEGMSVPSGVYLYRLKSAEFTQTNRCVLMK